MASNNTHELEPTQESNPGVAPKTGSKDSFLDRRMTRGAFIGGAAAFFGSLLLPKPASADHDPEVGTEGAHAGPLETDDLAPIGDGEILGAPNPASPADAEVAAILSPLDIAKNKIHDKMVFYTSINNERSYKGKNADTAIVENALDRMADVVYKLNAPGVKSPATALLSTFEFVLESNDTINPNFSQNAVFLTEVVPRGENSGFKGLPDRNISLPFLSTIGWSEQAQKWVTFSIKADAAVIEANQNDTAFLIFSLFHTARYNIAMAKKEQSMRTEGYTPDEIRNYLLRPANATILAFEAAQAMIGLYDNIKPQLQGLGIPDSEIFARFRKAWASTDIQGRQDLTRDFFFGAKLAA